MRHRHPLQHFQRGVVLHRSRFVDATVAVGGVLAEADVGDDHQIGSQVLDGPDGPLHRSRRAVRLAPLLVLGLGDAEDQDSRDPEIHHLANFVHQPVHRKAEDSRKRRDLFHLSHAGNDEDRIDQIVHGQGRLPDHAPQGFSAPQPAHAVRGKHHLTPPQAPER